MGFLTKKEVSSFCPADAFGDLTCLSVDKIKSNPLDIEAFRQELAVKYPTFAPPPEPPVALAATPIVKTVTPAALTRRLSEAYSPIPVRHHYHHDEPEQNFQGHGSGFPGQLQQSNSYFRMNQQVPTPAPSPPPTQKAKKQQYQTDQNRPFLFPFSKATLSGREPKLVPFAIEEADKLFNKHMYVSLALWQMWRTREDCMTLESGLERLPGVDAGIRSSTYLEVRLLPTQETTSS